MRSIDPPRTVWDLLRGAAARHAERPAIVEDGVALSYRDLAGRAAVVAGLLRPALGRSPRVAILADNGTPYVILYWGTLLAGGTTVELNPGLGDAELRDELRRSDPALLLALPDHAERLAGLGLDARGTTVRVAALSPSFPGLAPGWADALGAALEGRPAGSAAPAAPTEIRPQQLASIVYTSGTTGQVKGVCLTHENLAFVTASIAASFALPREAPEERLSGNLPLYYTYGKSVLLLATYLGGSIAFTRFVPSARTLLALVREAPVTHLSLVPFWGNLLLGHDEFTEAALPELRRITIAGGALHPAALDEMLRRFPGRVVPMYGLTEASTRATCMPPGECERRRGSCGRPIPGVEVAIGDAGGNPLPALETGEVLVRGPNVMQGYFRDPEATASCMHGAWVRSGDLGFLDRDGYLTITGRSKDVIKIMGESVAAPVVEAAIAELPGVAEVAVTGRPDPQTGEAIWAFVVPQAGAELSSDRVRRHCLRALGRARVPTRVVFLDALPKTSSGKVRKHLLPDDAA